MNKTKKELKKFFVWSRNGICYCTTWFLILLLVCSKIYDTSSFSTIFLMKMIGLIIGGVLIFNTLFTSLIIKKWNFTTRLTIFMLIISIYQCVSFYLLSLFQTVGSVTEWLIFITIVLLFYFASLVIYHFYSKRKGEIYTKSLHAYQSKRKSEID